MPDKHSETQRWGGPGSSHEDATRKPTKGRETRSFGEPTNTPHSHVSGGGGERDRHHGHDDQAKADFEENSRDRRKP
jgi:hypothetical protein